MSRKMNCLLVSFLLFQAAVYPQNGPADSVVIGRIRDEGLHRSQVRYIGRNITDMAGPRLTNSPGFFRAANWAVDKLKDWGLSNAQLEPWGEFGYGWSVDRSCIALKSPYYEPLIGYAIPWSGSTRGMLSAPVYMVTRWDSASVARMADVTKGKIVLVRSTDTVIRSAFTASATRYTDSNLTHMRDEYMFSAADLKFFLPQVRRTICW